MGNTDFRKICEKIEEEICDVCVDPDELCSPIIDGIVNIDRYLDTNPKILWILKEPYDYVENGVAAGGGWHFSKDFLSKADLYTRMGKSHTTWHPIIYVSYGLLNNFMDYSEMSYISHDLSMMDVINRIAVINVKKLPGFTRTKDFRVIACAYQANKALLYKQLETYDPDIIIGGSTLHLFYEELGIAQKDLRIEGSLHFAHKKNKLFIHAYHPAQTQVCREIYVDDIMKVACNFWGEKGRVSKLK